MMTDLLSAIDPPSEDQLTTDEMFARWWSQYPRKVDKGTARKAFKRVLAKKIVKFDELMAGVMRYAMERTGEDPQFTKHPTTWLNAESWTNEPLTRPTPARSNFVSSAVAGIASRVRMSTAESAVEGIMSGLTDEDFT
jgi:hypothetical protein